MNDNDQNYVDIGIGYDFLPDLAPRDTPVKLRRVPLPLDGNERFQWRLVVVILALSVCRSRKASVEQIHTLVWAMNDPLNAQRFRRAWSGKRDELPLRGYVSGLLETLLVAHAEGLVEQLKNGSQRLTAKGLKVAESVEISDSTLGEAVRFIRDYAPINATQMWRHLGEV